jgi:hypothetical protein
LLVELDAASCDIEADRVDREAAGRADTVPTPASGVAELVDVAVGVLWVELSDRWRLEHARDVGDGIVCSVLRATDVQGVLAFVAGAEGGRRELRARGLATAAGPGHFFPSIKTIARAFTDSDASEP